MFRYEISLIQWLASNLKIVAERFWATPPYFCWQLAFYRHLPTSGRQNTVKTTPQPLFVNSAFVALYVSIILPIGPIPISLFVSELEAKDLRISVFHKFACRFGEKVRRPAADSILMPPTFHVANFNRYTPTVSWCPVLVSTVWPLGPPKVRRCRFFFRLKKAVSGVFLINPFSQSNG